MPDSSVEIATEALTLLGDQSITALTEDSDRARVMNRLYVPTLDEALRSHDWNFARMRVALARLTAVPVYGYDFMYQLPQNPLCLRVLTTNLDADEPWEIETYKTTDGTAQYRVILTDATSIDIRYIARIEDPTLWDPLFADAFVYELAQRAAYAITRNATLAGLLRQEAEMKWRAARSVDGQEARALKKFLSTSFTQVR